MRFRFPCDAVRMKFDDIKMDNDIVIPFSFAINFAQKFPSCRIHIMKDRNGGSESVLPSHNTFVLPENTQDGSNLA